MKALFHIPDRLSGWGLDAALSGLQQLAEVDVYTGAVPWLYESGVSYIREGKPRGRGHITEHWMSPSVVMEHGGADCEDLAAWRAAELVVSGEDPLATAIALRSGPRTWHAVVQRGDGTIEDPSAALGMRGRGNIVPPVRFVVDASDPRNYHAHVVLEGLGGWERREAVNGCCVAAVGAALEDAASSTSLGQIPIISPILDVFSDAFSLAQGKGRKQPQQQQQPLQQPERDESLEEGVLSLARQLNRIARREVAKKWRRAQRGA